MAKMMNLMLDKAVSKIYQKWWKNEMGKKALDKVFVP